jgi:hypothetical protein
MWLGSEQNSNSLPCGIKWVTEVFSLGFWFAVDQEEGINRNFSDKFDKFCRALNMWKGRLLSLKGKITVIKNIAMPVLLYATSNLPIPEDLVDKVNEQVYHFIWDKKPEKISRETLRTEIENGGMKMIHFEYMFKAQKLMWAKRIASSGMASWKAYPLGCMAPIGVDIFKCSYRPNSVPFDLPLFYHQVLFAWGECRHATKKDINNAWDVRREPLFFNAEIQINRTYVGSSLMHWYRNGIFLIHDILDEKGQFLSAPKLTEMYNLKIDVLAYNGLKDAIPIQWRRLVTKCTVTKQAISSGESLFLNLNDSAKPMSLLSNKDVYRIWQNQKPAVPKCIARWTLYYPVNNFQWSDIFKLPFTTVRCTLVQSLQYKVIHRIFPCNYWLSKWEHNTSDQCVRCDQIDYLGHYFYNCKPIYSFWKSFTSWWQHNMEERLELSETDILVGYFGKSNWIRAINYCILYGKLFITRIVYHKSTPLLYSFLLQLKSAFSKEKYICQRNFQIEMFNTDFGKLYESLG